MTDRLDREKEIEMINIVFFICDDAPGLWQNRIITIVLIFYRMHLLKIMLLVLSLAVSNAVLISGSSFKVDAD